MNSGAGIQVHFKGLPNVYLTFLAAVIRALHSPTGSTPPQTEYKNSRRRCSPPPDDPQIDTVACLPQLVSHHWVRGPPRLPPPATSRPSPTPAPPRRSALHDPPPTPNRHSRGAEVGQPTSRSGRGRPATTSATCTVCERNICFEIFKRVG